MNSTLERETPVSRNYTKWLSRERSHSTYIRKRESRTFGQVRNSASNIPRKAVTRIVGTGSLRLEAMPAKDIQIEGFPCTIVYGKNNRLANLLSVSPPQHRLRPKLSPKRDSLKPWILIRQKVRQFAQLSKGWDSYNAAPPSREAIQNTLTFLKLLESVQLYPDWVEPTSDDSIMLEVRVGGVLEEWDFYSDGDVAVLHEFPTGQTECRMVNPALWEMAVQLFAPTYGKK